MTQSTEQPSRQANWRLRDWIAAAGLLIATAAVVLWQNAHLAVFWDLSYILDSSFRMALGQVPYRDFPFVHAPLTFLIQAAIMRLTGRVYFHHVLYAAVVGGLGTVLAWRIALHTLRGRVAGAWTVSLLLAVPLTVLGIYCILPLPSYDGDCGFAILIAVLLLQRLTPDDAERTRGEIGSLLRPFAAGAAVVLPLFFKQNIGLPLLAGTLGTIALLIGARLIQRAPGCQASFSPLQGVLAGTVTTLAAAGLLLHCTAGVGNYIHWTMQFAAERRLPGFSEMVGIYREPSLLWMLPCVAAGLFLWHARLAKSRWARLLALALLAAPFLWTLFALFLSDDADDRTLSLLALWPLLLILSAALTLFYLLRGPIHRILLPVVALAAIHGTLLSQQLWGSTYAIWPLLILLVAEMIAFLGTVKVPDPPNSPIMNPAPALAAVIAATLLVCGGFYTASEERLSYVQLPDGPVEHATFPELAGMSTPGPYLANFEELLRFAAANIPASEGLILLPGEDPFYFATGRAPQFPLLLFDPATDPYSPGQILELAQSRNIRWLIVKRELQMKEDVTPQREALMEALMVDFTLSSRLKGYDVYRRYRSGPGGP